MIRPGRFFWKLFLGNAILVVTILAISVFVIIREVEGLYRTDLRDQLLVLAGTIRHQVQDRFDAAHAPELDALAKSITAQAAPGVRISLIAPNGRVLADSDVDPARTESHADRPEVIAALANGQGDAVRASNTVGRELKYVALRVGAADAPIGVVRVAMPVRGISARTQTTRRLIWLIGAVGLLAAVMLALGLAYVWSAPIRRISATARDLSEGDLSVRADVVGSDELGQMARSLNLMRDYLATQLQTIDRQRRNLEYLIRGLTEGVIVAGPSGQIVLLNPAASRLLEALRERTADDGGDAAPDGAAAPVPVVGQSIDECVPQPELRELLRPRARLRRTTPGDGSGDVGGTNGESHVGVTRLQIDAPSGVISLMARASDIDLWPSDAVDAQNTIGRLVVLTDITELTRTIQIKTDFVANASHELRTPLSAIRASVETLLHMDLAGDTTAARQFLEVIDRHSGRLEEIVRDLLDLSRLESPLAQFAPAPLSLPELLAELHGRFSHAIAARRLAWRLDCPPDSAELLASPQLLRLVLDNLVDNAVKFSDEGGIVGVACRRSGDDVQIEVSDTGCGIPTEDQSRVFERFYQVGRARSGFSGHQAGMLRGTGLGLSIVKHAVAAMHGKVRLRSRVGEGTVVVVTLPRSAPAPGERRADLAPV
ncbi:MAG: ATP-binding protein [Phycisphaerae bacterium]|nr:ATP-binding protein [Phycisphaerae bacterium]